MILLMTGRAKEAQEQVTLAKKHGFKPPAGLVADIDKAVADGPKTSQLRVAYAEHRAPGRCDTHRRRVHRVRPR